MNKHLVRFSIAALTFTFGIIAALAWHELIGGHYCSPAHYYTHNAAPVPPSDVDRRLITAIRQVHLKNTETEIKRRGLSPESAARLRSNSQSAEFADWLRKDVENTNAGCRRDNLSAAACDERKEAAMRDIEENILPVEMPTNEPDILQQKFRISYESAPDSKETAIRIMPVTEK